MFSFSHDVFYTRFILRYDQKSCNVSKSSQISNFMKIRLVGAEVFHVDRRTDMTTVIVALHNYAIAYKNERTLQIKLALSSVA